MLSHHCRSTISRNGNKIGNRNTIFSEVMFDNIIAVVVVFNYMQKSISRQMLNRAWTWYNPEVRLRYMERSTLESQRKFYIAKNIIQLWLEINGNFVNAASNSVVAKWQIDGLLFHCHALLAYRKGWFSELFAICVRSRFLCLKKTEFVASLQPMFIKLVCNSTWM